MNNFLEKIKKNNPKYAEHIENVLEHDYSWVWEDLVSHLVSDNIDDALKVAVFYKNKNKEHYSPYMVLAKTYAKINKNKLAINICEEAIKNNVLGLTSLYTVYFDILENHSKIKDVIKKYKSLLENKPHLPTHRKFIRYLLKSKKYKICENECFFVLNKYNKKAITVNIYLSDSYKNRKKYKKAKSALMNVVKNKPKNGEAWRKLNEIEKLIISNPENIVRSIEFKPEYHASGISILQNFGKLLRDKYADTPVKVTITQENLSVKMVISPPNGKKLEVEEYLSKYGLVVQGKIRPEEFLSDPLKIMELKTELKMAETRIELQREQLKYLGNNSSSRISSLEEEVMWLRNHVANSLEAKEKNISSLFDLFPLVNSSSETVKNIINNIENEDNKKLEKNIEILKKEQPINYSKLKDFISNTISSAGANAPAWIEFLSKIII